MFSPELQKLIEASLTDGVLTDKERAIIRKRAMLEGADPDEVDLLLDSELQKLQLKQEAAVKKVKKCPNCGEIIPAMAVKCPTCGIELSGLESNKIVEYFSKGIKDGEADFVRSFAIPNNADDLYELTVFISNAAKSSSMDDDVKDALKQKLNECTDKIKILFPNDERFKKVLSSTKLNFWQKMSSGTKGGIIFFAVVVFICWGLYHCAFGGTSHIDEIRDDVEEAIKDNDTEKAASLLRKTKSYYKEDLVPQYQRLINMYIAKDDVQGAINVVTEFGQPEYMKVDELRTAYRGFYTSIYDYYLNKGDEANAVRYSPSNVSLMFLDLEQKEMEENKPSTTQPTQSSTQTPTPAEQVENTESDEETTSSTTTADEEESGDETSETEDGGIKSKVKEKYHKLKDKAAGATKSAIQKMKDKLDE